MERNSPAISVIVPVYNVEKTIRKAVDSILSQTFHDFELLLIDDGTPDASGAICDEYAKRDNRISVYHKPNGGLSDARNYGLSRAQGKYTIFVDSDDWVDADGLDKLYEKAEEEHADMTICDLYREDEYARHYMKQQPSQLNHEVVLKELFRNIGGFTHNKLIRRALYKDFNISYPKGIYGCEDQYVMARFLMHDIKIAYVPVAFYHYMYNGNSLTRHYDENTYQMDIRILEMFSELLKGTTAIDVAQENKFNSIFTRAFWNGGKYYSSESFKERFGKYRQTVSSLNEQRVVKWFMYLACIGYYRSSNKIIFSLFRMKRACKMLLTKVKTK